MTPKDRKERKKIVNKLRNDKESREHFKKALELTEEELQILEKMLEQAHLTGVDAYSPTSEEEDKILKKLAVRGFIKLTNPENLPN